MAKQTALNFGEVDQDKRRNDDREFLARCNAAQRLEMERELSRPLAAGSIQQRLDGLDVSEVQGLSLF